jgi:four helix bundle protein
MKTYKDLIVWRKSMDLVTQVYKLTKGFPSEEIYSLTAQMRRCAVSIPSNIAEGYARNSSKDYIRFLRVARGSLYELQTQLEIALNLSYLNNNDHEQLQSLNESIAKMLNALIGKVSLSEKP